ncbi:MAG: PAS domain S-box protein [Nitrospirota bacterium]
MKKPNLPSPSKKKRTSTPLKTAMRRGLTATSSSESDERCGALVELSPDAVAERRSLEEALKKNHAEQEIRVQERTAELVKANEALNRSETLTRIVLDAVPIGVWLVDAAGKIVEGNPAGRRIWAGARYVGIEQYGEYKGRRVGTGERIEPEEWAAARAIRNGETSIDEEIEIECFDGTHKIILNSAIPIRNEQQEITGAIIVNQDITERKEIETRTEITNRLLKLFTQKVTRQDYLDQALELIRAWSRCRCAGIRILHENGDIPYESSVGFSKEFRESECLLSIHKDQCACIRVIIETPEPQDAPAMTRAGSFYSNSMMQFVAGLTETEKLRFRAGCVSNEFASIAVIPIRYHDKILGAIHLADEREGLVPLTKVEFLEVLAFLIGEALYKFDVENELRKNYDLLRENNELLENMFSNIHVMIAYMDTDFNFVRVNRTYAEADGRTPEFYPGRNHFALYPNEEKEAIFRRVVETGEPYFAYEKPFVYAEHPEHGVTYWDWSLMPVKESDGGIIGVMMSLIDVTDRKLAEVERDRLAAAVGATADAVAITEPLGGLIQYVNPAFERITGYARDEVVGRSLHILDSGKQDAAFYQELRETLERDGVWRGRLINKKKDGALYFEECTYSPVRDPSGKIMNYVSVKRDMTEKLRLESIAESVNTMENIGCVFSGVRHEIGNPINTAKMILSVLQHKLDKSTKEDIREQIDRTMTEIARVEYLLKSLKNFNLYESLDIQAVDMEAFLTRFLSLVAEDYDRKNITIKTDLSPEAARAYADPRALQHVLLNVFSNAADALEGRDDPTILITVLKRNGRIHIGVADNGSGMSGTQQKDLFKPFYTSKKHGTGLGLVIVKKMLAKMNGTIEVTSVQNEGTTVDIALPEGRDGTQQ